MGFDDMAVSFAISIGAGYVPSIIAKIKGDKTLEDRINICFKKALSNWNVSQETRELLKCDTLKYYTELQGYLNDTAKGRHPKIKELLRFWIKEMQNDELCCNFIIQHKQELADCKLNEVLSLLKGEVSLMLSEISNKQDSMQMCLNEIFAKVQLLGQSGNQNLAPNIMAILNGAVTTLIENLKVDSARKVINELEIQFAQCIQANKNLQAEISFKKGQTLLTTDSNKAIRLIHNAYELLPNNNIYKQWEIRRLLAMKKYNDAETITSSLLDEPKWKYLVKIVCADDEAQAYEDVIEDIKKDYCFRQILLESLLNKGSENVNFLLEDNNLEVPEYLTFSTLNAWLYILSYYRGKIGNFMVLSFAASQIENIKPALEVVNAFYEKLSNTEVKDNFPLIRCLYCYWNYVCSHDSDWIDEYQKINKLNFGEQKLIFSLIEASMLVLATRFEEAFAVIVSVSKEIDNSIIRFVIMMSIQSDNIMHLKWILERMKNEHIMVDSDVAVLIAHSIHRVRAMDTKAILQDVEFKVEAEKKLLLQLCAFHDSQKVNVSTFKDDVNDMCDELKAYAANLLADSGDTEMAFNMLQPIVDENVPDIKRSLFISVLSKMQEKTPDLYRILVKNRQAGNFCDDQLLRIEYQLDSQIADIENALAAITLLYHRHPNNSELFVRYIFTLSHVHPERLVEFEKKALEVQYPDIQMTVLAYRTFSENGFLETATELLYRAAKVTEDYELKTFYHNETLGGIISSVARKEYEVAEEGNYVLCDINGKRIFYKAMLNGNAVGKAMLGVHKEDIVETEISFNKITMVVIGVYNKYYKLASDIMHEAQDGSNPGLIPFQIDEERPLESLKEFIRKMSKDEPTPEEKWKCACEQYENGEIGLLQLVNEDNILAGYYKLLFTPFKIHVNVCLHDMQMLPQISDAMTFVLDMPTVITFAEFSAKTGIEINGPMTITTILHEYIKSTDKFVMRVTDSDLYEAIGTGKLIKYHDYVDVDAKHHIHALLEWINNHCTDVVADKALALFSQDDTPPLKKQLFSSLSMLLQPNCYFVTDDRKIKSLLPGTNIITTETFVRLFNNQSTSSVYSEFLFENNFVGVELTESYIESEYQKMKNHDDNMMVTIMQNMQENPFLLSKAVTVCMQLASSEFDLNTLKITFTNLFTMGLKGLPLNSRKHIIQNIIRKLNVPIACVQLTRQCLLDAAIIAVGFTPN